MTGMLHIVKCYDRRGQLVHCSECSTFDTLIAPAPCLPDDALIRQAKTELTNLRKAFPTYDGFRFETQHERF